MMAKYLLLKHYRGAPASVNDVPMDRWTPEEVDAHRLAAILGDVRPAARVSPWFGYAPLDPAHVANTDGIVFVKDSRRG